MSFLSHLFKPSAATALAARQTTTTTTTTKFCVAIKKEVVLSKKKKLKLKYFDIPAIGEPIRLLLEIGGFDWEDMRIDFKSWGAIKPTTKWGQMPTLSFDDLELAQSKSICRYLAKTVKLEGATLYPSDPYVAYLVDEMLDAFDDVRLLIVPTFSINDPADKEAARRALFAPDGKASLLLAKMDALSAAGGTAWLVSEQPTLADVWCFFMLNFLRCGFFDGLASDVGRELKKLDAIRGKIARMPQVQAYYKPMAAAKPMYVPFAEQ